MSFNKKDNIDWIGSFLYVENAANSTGEEFMKGKLEESWLLSSFLKTMVDSGELRRLTGLASVKIIGEVLVSSHNNAIKKKWHWSYSNYQRAVYFQISGNIQVIDISQISVIHYTLKGR